MTFGPTFADELQAAGLGGVPIVWGGDGAISGREHLSDAQNASLDAVIAAHDPTRQLPPPPPEPLFESAGSFTVANGLVTVAPNVKNLGTVLRAAKGYFRVYIVPARADTLYHPSLDLMDGKLISDATAVRGWRITKKATTYFEFRCWDQAFAAADPSEVFVRIFEVK